MTLHLKLLRSIAMAAANDALLQAALMQGDDHNANDAVRDRFALQPQLLQPLPRYLVDRYLPVAVWQAPPGRGPNRTLDQGAALLGDLNRLHRLMEVLAGLNRPVLA